MIYFLIIFMIVKLWGVTWSVGTFIDQRNFQKQLEITTSFSILLFSATGVVYYVDYPIPWDLRPMYIVFAYMALEYSLIRGLAVMSQLAFYYLYGHAKRRPRRVNKVTRLLTGLILAMYFVIGLIGVFLLY